MLLYRIVIHIICSVKHIRYTHIIIIYNLLLFKLFTSDYRNYITYSEFTGYLVMIILDSLLFHLRQFNICM